MIGGWIVFNGTFGTLLAISGCNSLNLYIYMCSHDFYPVFTVPKLAETLDKIRIIISEQKYKQKIQLTRCGDNLDSL